MSILAVEIVSEGMIFGADRNTTITTYPGGSTRQGTPQQKVLKWPNNNVLFGFVGNAKINGMPIKDWLNSIQHDFQFLTSIEQIAKTLKDKIEAQRNIDEGTNPASLLIIHLGSFERQNGVWLPFVWHITNTHSLGRYGYHDVNKNYTCVEHMYGPLKDVNPTEVRRFLKVMAKNFEPMWFHQGLDLATFNVLESSIKTSFKLLCEQHPDHNIPASLDDWSKHVKMKILMYGAYYEAFSPVGKRSVGGGADVESLDWPPN